MKTFSLIALFSAAGLLTGGRLAANAQQILYVGDNNGDVSAVRPDGSLKPIFGQTYGVAGIATDSAGALYSVYYGPYLFKTIPNGFSYAIARSPLFYQGLDLVCDHSGNLYESVINYDANSNSSYRILKITQSGDVSVFSDNGNYASGLAIDRNDNLFVGGLSRIDEIKPNGERTVFRYVTSYRTGAMAFDNEGNLYQANYLDDTIERYSSSGADLGVYAHTGAPSVALAFDQNDNLYASNYLSHFGNGSDGAEIIKYSPQGQSSTIIAYSTGRLFSSLAFSPAAVPEPGAFTLTFGLAGAGVILLRKRRGKPRRRP